jgi:hypothetical protein
VKSHQDDSEGEKINLEKSHQDDSEGEKINLLKSHQDDSEGEKINLVKSRRDERLPEIVPKYERLPSVIFSPSVLLPIPLHVPTTR